VALTEQLQNNRLNTVSAIHAVKRVSFESSPDDVPGHFVKFHSQSVADANSVQREFHLLSQPLSMQFFKLVLHEGWDTFSAVRRCGAGCICSLELVRHHDAMWSLFNVPAEYRSLETCELWHALLPNLESALFRWVCNGAPVGAQTRPGCTSGVLENSQRQSKGQLRAR
jgi:hypothetical protein